MARALVSSVIRDYLSKVTHDKGEARQGEARQGKARARMSKHGEQMNEEAQLTGEYPIDTESLSKGDTITAETIERAFGVRRGTDAFNLASMKASNYIARRFLDRGEVVTITQRKQNLVILTDEEMPTHNARLFRNDIKRAARTHMRMLGGDRSKMSEETQKVHDRELTVQGAQLSAVSRARRELRASSVQRQTPALLAKKV